MDLCPHLLNKFNVTGESSLLQLDLCPYLLTKFNVTGESSRLQLRGAVSLN